MSKQSKKDVDKVIKAIFGSDKKSTASSKENITDPELIENKTKCGRAPIKSEADIQSVFREISSEGTKRWVHEEIADPKKKRKERELEREREQERINARIRKIKMQRIEQEAKDMAFCLKARMDEKGLTDEDIIKLVTQILIDDKAIIEFVLSTVPPQKKGKGYGPEFRDSYEVTVKALQIVRDEALERDEIAHGEVPTKTYKR